MQASIPAPAVTFCPHISDSGWRRATNLSAGQFITGLCGEVEPEGVERCVRENTFPRSIKQNLMNSSLWSSSMATVYTGLCHTFNYPLPLSTQLNTESFLFYLETNVSYRLIIHDPKFYHIVMNNLAFPRVLLNYQSEKQLRPGHYEHCGLTLTQHHLLNRPEQPCEEAEDYNFLECVKTSQARRVGCRPPWDSWSPPTLPLCQTLEELQHHEELDNTSLQSDQQMIVNQTGCNIPCQFKVGHLRKSQQLNTYFPGL